MSASEIYWVARQVLNSKYNNNTKRKIMALQQWTPITNKELDEMIEYEFENAQPLTKEDLNDMAKNNRILLDKMDKHQDKH